MVSGHPTIMASGNPPRWCQATSWWHCLSLRSPTPLMVSRLLTHSPHRHCLSLRSLTPLMVSGLPKHTHHRHCLRLWSPTPPNGQWTSHTHCLSPRSLTPLMVGRFPTHTRHWHHLSFHPQHPLLVSGLLPPHVQWWCSRIGGVMMSLSLQLWMVAILKWGKRENQVTVILLPTLCRITTSTSRTRDRT